MKCCATTTLVRRLRGCARRSIAVRSWPACSIWDFSFRVSAQRCFDNAQFIRATPFVNDALEHAALLRLRQAEYYGEAQWAIVARDMSRVADMFEELARLEEELSDALDQGLRTSA